MVTGQSLGPSGVVVTRKSRMPTPYKEHWLFLGLTDVSHMSPNDRTTSTILLIKAIMLWQEKQCKLLESKASSPCHSYAIVPHIGTIQTLIPARLIKVDTGKVKSPQQYILS